MRNEIFKYKKVNNMKGVFYMKKYVKVVSVILMVFLVVAMASPVFAYQPKNVVGNQAGTTSIQNIGGQILGIVQVVGTIAAVIILVIIGIKYMMGSAQEKAEYKKTMIPYIIGAIIIFAASNIAQMVYNWASTISA